MVGTGVFQGGALCSVQRMWRGWWRRWWSHSPRIPVWPVGCVPSALYWIDNGWIDAGAVSFRRRVVVVVEAEPEVMTMAAVAVAW